MVGVLFVCRRPVLVDLGTLGTLGSRWRCGCGAGGLVCAVSDLVGCENCSRAVALASSGQRTVVGQWGEVGSPGPVVH